MQRCLVCYTKENITRDHVVPRVVLRMVMEREEYFDFCQNVRKANIQPLCGPCNGYKSSRVADLRNATERERLLGFMDDYGIIDRVDFEDPEVFLREVRTWSQNRR